MKLYKHQEDALERTKTFNKDAMLQDMGVRQNFKKKKKNANAKH